MDCFSTGADSLEIQALAPIRNHLEQNAASDESIVAALAAADYAPETAPYGHNGFFATLEDLVRFYNVKNDGSFGPPEVPETENREEIGALGLSAREEAAIVAFLKALTDR